MLFQATSGFYDPLLIRLKNHKVYYDFSRIAFSVIYVIACYF